MSILWVTRPFGGPNYYGVIRRLMDMDATYTTPALGSACLFAVIQLYTTKSILNPHSFHSTEELPISFAMDIDEKTEDVPPLQSPDPASKDGEEDAPVNDPKDATRDESAQKLERAQESIQSQSQSHSPIPQTISNKQDNLLPSSSPSHSTATADTNT